MNEFTVGKRLQKAMFRHRMEAGEAWNENANELDEGQPFGLPYFEEANAKALIGKRYKANEDWLKKGGFSSGVVDCVREIGGQWKVMLRSDSDEHFVNWVTKTELRDHFVPDLDSPKVADMDHQGTLVDRSSQQDLSI